MSEKMIPLSVPNLKGNELAYVTHAVETEWVSTAGPYINDFEIKIAEYLGVNGAVACQNGTSGLHVALLLSGVTKEDAVIVPTLTFIAAVNPVKYIGAEAFFMDCDETLTLDVEKLRLFCENECDMKDGHLVHSATNRIIKTIVVVHVFGNMADMEQIMSIAEQYHLKVVEDATEALGTYYLSGKYQGKHAGTIGDLGVYSFNGNKIITTGGGGMIVSSDPQLLERAKHLTTQAKSDELHYTHDEIGYNYRMTNLQAALGLAQLEQLEGFIEVKNKNYQLYNEELINVPGLALMPFRKDIRSNCWFYSVYVQDHFPMDREGVIQALGKMNIQSRPIWGLIHQQVPYAGSVSYEIKQAQAYIDHIVNIPCSTNLTEDEVRYVVSMLRQLSVSKEDR